MQLDLARPMNGSYVQNSSAKMGYCCGGWPLWATRSVVRIYAAMRRASFLCSLRSSMFR